MRLLIPIVVSILLFSVSTILPAFAGHGVFIVADGNGGLKQVFPDGTVNTIATPFGFARGVAVNATGDYIVSVGGSLLGISPNGNVELLHPVDLELQMVLQLMQPVIIL